MHSTALATRDLVEPWSMPASFLALNDLNFALILEKANSIGLYSGEYGTLKMAQNPSFAISYIDLLLLCADKLSIKRAILSSPFIVLNSYMNCLNLAMFTDLSKIL